MCWGLATARHCTPALGHIMEAALQPPALHSGLLPDGVAKMKARHVTALLWGCAVLLHQPSAVLNNLAIMMQSTTHAAGWTPGHYRHLQSNSVAQSTTTSSLFSGKLFFCQTQPVTLCSETDVNNSSMQFESSFSLANLTCAACGGLDQAELLLICRSVQL